MWLWPDVLNDVVLSGVLNYVVLPGVLNDVAAAWCVE